MISATGVMKILASLSLIGCLAVISQPVSALDDGVVIYQLQTGGSIASQEYIAIYNNTPDPVDITGWCLTYSSAPDASQKQLNCFESSGWDSRLMLGAHSSALMNTVEFLQGRPDSFRPDRLFPAGIAATGGHIRLIRPDGVVMDTLGWGTATRPEGTVAAAPPAGKILQRLAGQSDTLLDTNNNSADFSTEVLNSFPARNLYNESRPPVPVTESTLKITELLPDASGADTGNEYIEFHNYGDEPVSLGDYALQVGPSYNKTYSLPGLVLQPGEYVALTDTQTGVTLPNTSASVRLLSKEGTITDTTEPYSDLGEAVAWAWDGLNWQKTYQPSPNAENVILADKPCPEGEVRSPDTGYCRGIDVAGNSSSTAAQCLPGYERNPATNRCRKLAVPNSPQPCKLAQVRDISTGRCRNIASAASKQTACKSNQQRNPITNRCKNIAAASPAKSCPAGQERNPETGRCRKSTKSNAIMQRVKDVKTPLAGSGAKWWMAGLAVVGSAGYAFYEWRREIYSFLSGFAPGLPKF